MEKQIDFSAWRLKPLDSFMIKGQNDDLFFCELHDDGKYRIKAALGGNYPFRYINEGKL